MPTISIFYGIQIMMYFYDNTQHNTPHIHAEYQDDEAGIFHFGRRNTVG